MIDIILDIAVIVTDLVVIATILLNWKRTKK